MPPPAYDVVPVIFAGEVAVLAGVLVARWRPGHRGAWLLVAMGFVTLLTLLSFSNHALPFTIGGLLVGTQNAVALHLLLALPDGALETRADRVLVGTVYGVTVASKVLPNLFLDCTNPFGLGCPGNLLAVGDDPDLVGAAGSRMGGSRCGGRGTGRSPVGGPVVGVGADASPGVVGALSGRRADARPH